MPRRLVALFAALLLGVGLATQAQAHGGNWRSPSKQKSPEREDPGGKSPRPTSTTPRNPARSPRPGRRGSEPRGRSRRGLGNVAEWQPGSWETWWFLNRDAFLPRRATPLLPRTVATAGEERTDGTPSRPDPGACLDPWARVVALPYLVRLLDPKADVSSEIRAVALLAVGRTTREATPIDWILHHATNAKADLEVRESGVLALGLLRRSGSGLQQTPETLGRVRDALLGIADVTSNPMRVRAFAVFALALLSDQPYGTSALERDGRLITRALWLRLNQPGHEPELRIALLTALGHQPPRGVPSTVLDGLRSIATGRARMAFDDLERGHALAAVGRLGAPDCLASVRRALSMRGEHAAVHTAAMIAYAHRAERMTAEERVDAVRSIRRHLAGECAGTVRRLAMVALGALQGADLRMGSCAVLDETDAAAHLLRDVRKGTSSARPFAALGLGLAVWEVEVTSRPIGVFRDKARAAIVTALERGRGTDHLVGAFAVAAGLARAEAARDTLLEILANQNRQPGLRGHCALSLGVLPNADDACRAVLLASLKERISPFVHLQSARALGLLADPDVAPELVRQLRHAWTQRSTLAPVASALGRLKDATASRVLLELARDETEPLRVRVACVMALGLAFDPEPRPSRIRLTTHANYPSLTWSLAQVFNIM